MRAWLADTTGLDGTWHEATVVDRGEGGTATLRRDDGAGAPVVVSAEELKLVNNLPETGVEDMTKLDYLHEPALLNNLRRRFSQDQLYTYTGRICIAVNPFNWQASSQTPHCHIPRMQRRMVHARTGRSRGRSTTRAFFAATARRASARCHHTSSRSPRPRTNTSAPLEGLDLAAACRRPCW